SNSLARRDPRNDSCTPTVCDHRWDASCRGKSYCLEFRNHTAHRKPAFFLANEMNCVPDIRYHWNPLAGMVHQSVNTCKQDEQLSFRQHRDFRRKSVVVAKSQLFQRHRIVFVNDRHNVLAFEQTAQRVLRILMTDTTIQVAVCEQELCNVKVVSCEHRGIKMHQL